MSSSLTVLAYPRPFLGSPKANRNQPTSGRKRGTHTTVGPSENDQQKDSHSLNIEGHRHSHSRPNELRSGGGSAFAPPPLSLSLSANWLLAAARLPVCSYNDCSITPSVCLSEGMSATHKRREHRPIDVLSFVMRRNALMTPHDSYNSTQLSLACQPHTL